MRQRRLADPEPDWTLFLIGCGVTGVFSFLLGLANILSIKVTSPTSRVIQTILNDVRSVLLVYRLGGITLITFATIFYTWTQAQALYEPVPTVDNLEEDRDEEMEQDVSEIAAARQSLRTRTFLFFLAWILLCCGNETE
ncbi:hypothetical protein C8F01DRAFT_339316 [Mycena amicta]|nr:hypothetical protein C8F01DRAFT_339316 [Mycena amicta]